MPGGYSNSNDLVQIGFSRANPRIGYLPHILAKSSERALRVLASAIDGPLGLWGERPLYDARGRSYLEPSNGKIIEDFALWKLEANQAYLFERATVGPDPVFKMFISANTPTKVLQRTYDHFAESSESSDVPQFADYIDFVCDWIAGLQWVFVPLEGEINWSILAVAPDLGVLLAKVTSEFRRNGISLACLIRTGDRLKWVAEEAEG